MRWRRAGWPGSRPEGTVPPAAHVHRRGRRGKRQQGCGVRRFGVRRTPAVVVCPPVRATCGRGSARVREVLTGEVEQALRASPVVVSQGRHPRPVVLGLQARAGDAVRDAAHRAGQRLRVPQVQRGPGRGDDPPPPRGTVWAGTRMRGSRRTQCPAWSVAYRSCGSSQNGHSGGAGGRGRWRLRGARGRLLSDGHGRRRAGPGRTRRTRCPPWAKDPGGAPGSGRTRTGRTRWGTGLAVCRGTPREAPVDTGGTEGGAGPRPCRLHDARETPGPGPRTAPCRERAGRAPGVPAVSCEVRRPSAAGSRSGRARARSPRPRTR